MTNSTLLLGNGLNRTLPNGISWNALLRQLGDISDPKSRDQIPSPILFEQIAARKGTLPHLRNNDMFKKLKVDAAKLIQEKYAEPGYLHKQFAKIPFDNIITTNYDECFENAYEDREKSIVNPGQSRNILESVMTVDGKPLYYAHGTIKWPKTICLGYEHYISLITKIRNELYPKNSNDDRENQSHLINILKRNIKQTIWPELLFTSNVYIVGFDLGFSEIDFWWLLALRSALFALNNHVSQYANQIKYYFIDSDNTNSTAKLNTLQSLGVDVVVKPTDDYSKGYQEIAKDILDDIERNQLEHIPLSTDSMIEQQ